ncbi:MAG: chitobiase/beta-hexosaminidase C-terminal domain-containing protein [Bacteroidaceae bacterium]|nr:chitobiase/beta-hexosaminidase C-terminal domain-containing protein [Bacteroidaceae bacterium]
MKKFLLSIFAVLFAFAGVQAEEVTLTCGTEITATTGNFLNGKLSLSCDKNSAQNSPAYNSSSKELRLYYGSGTGCSATLKTDGTIKITGIELVASSTSYTPAVNYFVDGGSAVAGTWSSTKMTISGIEATETFMFQNANTSNKQLRIKSIKVTYEAVAGAVETAIPPTVVGGEFVGSTTVVITNNDDDATLYYSVDDGAFEEYGGDFEINKDTKVAAYAQIGDDEETRSVTVTAEFTRVAADPVLVYDATSFDDKITVSVTSEDDVYYTLDGTKPNAESTPYETALTLKATATLKVIAIDAEGYASAVVEQKFTKNESASGAGETTLVTDASTLAVGDQIVIVASDYDYALSTTQNDNNRDQASVTKDGNNITYGANVQIITLEEGNVYGTFAFNVGTGYLYAASSSKNYLRTNANLDDNGSWTVSVTDGIASIIAQGSNTRNMMQYNQSSSIFSCYASDKPQKDISIYKVNKASIEAYTLSVSAAGWATLFLNYDAEIPTGVTCYAVSAVDGEYATLSPVTGVIPANTGVIVEASQGNYTFNVATKAGSDVASELIGTTVNTYITKEAYVLGIVDGVVGLYKAQMAGGVWLNNANKAYLPASVANGAASYSFHFGEGTTGISEVKGESGNVKGIYDLTGRRVEAITAPGIYIVGGKKVLVK